MLFVSTNSVRPLFHRLFDYLHEPAVIEVILSLVASPAEFKTSKIDELVASLHTHGIWSRIVQRIVDVREPEITSSHACVLVEGWIKKAQQNSRLATLLINDIDHKSDDDTSKTDSNGSSSGKRTDVLSQLLSVVSSTSITRIWQMHQCTRLLTTLITSWYISHC